MIVTRAQNMGPFKLYPVEDSFSWTTDISMSSKVQLFLSLSTVSIAGIKGLDSKQKE